MSGDTAWVRKQKIDIYKHEPCKNSDTALENALCTDFFALVSSRFAEIRELILEN